MEMNTAVTGGSEEDAGTSRGPSMARKAPACEGMSSCHDQVQPHCWTMKGPEKRLHVKECHHAMTKYNLTAGESQDLALKIGERGILLIKTCSSAISGACKQYPYLRHQRKQYTYLEHVSSTHTWNMKANSSQT
jgi:hypothetical protein